MSYTEQKSHSVFISYSSKDRNIAVSTREFLSSLGVNCWMAPESIRPGEQWADAIARVIPECPIMILLWTSDSMRSGQVINELTLADRSGVMVIPFRLEDIEPEGAFKYYLYKTHWLDAIDKAWKSKLELLGQRVLHNLPGDAELETKELTPKKPRKIQKPIKIAMLSFFGLSALTAGLITNSVRDRAENIAASKAREIRSNSAAADQAVSTVQDLYLYLTDKKF